MHTNEEKGVVTWTQLAHCTEQSSYNCAHFLLKNIIKVALLSSLLLKQKLELCIPLRWVQLAYWSQEQFMSGAAAVTLDIWIWWAMNIDMHYNIE